MKLPAVKLSAALILAGLAAAPAVAEMGQLPPEKTQGAVSYIAGGIGQDESDAIKRAAGRYALELEFSQTARPRNVYLADVKVAIRSASSGKTMLDTVSDGPYLVANLPPGKYNVTVEQNGATQQRSVDVKAGQHQRLAFVWPGTATDRATD